MALDALSGELTIAELASKYGVHANQISKWKKNVTGDDIFGPEFFCVTAGELTKEMVQEYLEHHFERNPNDGFDIEK